jgi:hypothetical protein
MSVILPDDWGDVGGSGKSMNQLGDEWWIRAFGLPEDKNPFTTDDLTDPRGRRGSVERANIDQPEPVFFLGGSFESRGNLPNPTRTVVVPEGAVLVLPTINGALPDGEDPKPKQFPDEATTRANVNGFFQDQEGNLVSVDSTVTVDGVEVGNFAESDRNTEFRRESPDGGFTYRLPPSNFVGVPPQKVEPAVADGYWFAYDTASFAQNESHTVNFTGDYADGAFVLNVTYNILNPIIGTNQGEVISGTDFNDYIVGDNGNDDITGVAGDDLILGGNGQDRIDGGIGSDELWGDNGKDTFVYELGYGTDTIFDFARNEVVEIEGFTELPEIEDVTLPSGISAAQITFNGSDILTFVNVASSDLSVNLDDGTITL